jgi:hypothetical protein
LIEISLITGIDWIERGWETITPHMWVKWLLANSSWFKPIKAGDKVSWR